MLLVFGLVLLAGQARAQYEEERYSSTLNDKLRAQARFEAEQAPLERLVRQRREAAEDAYRAREQEFLAGRGTLDMLLEVQVLIGKARSPLPKTVNVPLPVLEDAWLAAWFAYVLNEDRHEAGRATAADYFQSLHQLRDVEIQLALSRPKKK
jgi:hypothetical protein